MPVLHERRPPASRRPLTAPMLEALAALAEGDLSCFRVGYARGGRGPFFPHGTIESLWKRNLCDLSDRRYARTRICISPLGRSTLAASRAAAQGEAA